MAIDSDPFIDWPSRANGKPHRLTQGTHFDRDPRLVRKSAGMWALRHGYRCLSDMDETSVTVKFVPKSETV